SAPERRSQSPCLGARHRQKIGGTPGIGAQGQDREAGGTRGSPGSQGRRALQPAHGRRSLGFDQPRLQGSRSERGGEAGAGQPQRRDAPSGPHPRGAEGAGEVKVLAPSWRPRRGQMRRSLPNSDTPLSGRSRLDVPQKGAGEPDISTLSVIPATQATASNAKRGLRMVFGQFVGVG